ncbi:hypothetical protein [uncultured Celeribacter sp.]|uniref:hypothetical protein n=1 Tax=uncultured Celeribacter sp. TaxID=1303376 RepID=UPI002AA7C633|nr:hypothetical protein [uncultured Celeribacter sp.]
MPKLLGQEKLFEACVRHICAGYAADVRKLLLTGEDGIDQFRDQFRDLAETLVQMAVAERQLRFCRRVMGNSTLFPVIGRIWYESSLLTIKNATRNPVMGRHERERTGHIGQRVARRSGVPTVERGRCPVTPA